MPSSGTPMRLESKAAIGALRVSSSPFWVVGAALSQPSASKPQSMIDREMEAKEGWILIVGFLILVHAVCKLYIEEAFRHEEC